MCSTYFLKGQYIYNIQKKTHKKLTSFLPSHPHASKIRKLPLILRLEAFNYYQKALHLGCCSSPRPTSEHSSILMRAACLNNSKILMLGPQSPSIGSLQRVVKSLSPFFRSSLLTVPAPLLCLLIATTLGGINSTFPRKTLHQLKRFSSSVLLQRDLLYIMQRS